MVVRFQPPFTVPCLILKAGSYWGQYYCQAEVWNYSSCRWCVSVWQRLASDTVLSEPPYSFWGMVSHWVLALSHAYPSSTLLTKLSFSSGCTFAWWYGSNKVTGDSHSLTKGMLGIWYNYKCSGDLRKVVKSLGKMGQWPWQRRDGCCHGMGRSRATSSTTLCASLSGKQGWKELMVGKRHQKLTNLIKSRI